MTSVVSVTEPTSRGHGESGGRREEVDEQDLLDRLTPIVRLLVRDEMERYLRTSAD
jgi:hypothetical protein